MNTPNRPLFFTCVLLCFLFDLVAQPVPANWRATLQRADSNLVVFNLKSKQENGETVLYIINAGEEIRINDIKKAGDSVFFNMPVFESSFRARVLPNGNLQGTWIKGTAARTQFWPFAADMQKPARFAKVKGEPISSIAGRWTVTLTRPNGSTRPAIAEFVQTASTITGTFLTPSGDYRFLQGIVSGDSLMLSTFDGAHAYLFTARITDENNIADGHFYSGINGKEKWVAFRNEKAELPEEVNATRLKGGEERLNFQFPDIDGNQVSIRDKRFAGKAVIIQIMGSWCPNCMDETRFLSNYYDANKHRGVEVIALAYEYSTDFSRSQKTLRKFQQLFKVGYPMLITGISITDSLRTEKTLPEITPIKVFPTTLFLDRKGRVRNIHTGFYGPGAGEHHEGFKKEFYAIMDELLKEGD